MSRSTIQLCRILLLALATLWGGGAPAQEALPVPKGIGQTKESVPWAMAGYKFIEFYYGKDGHREIYEGQPVTVTALVSSVEVSRTGEIAVLLQDDRIMALPADPLDPQFAALRNFFEQEKAHLSSKSATYRNFYIKATIRGTCAASKRANKVDLRDATMVAWYGARALRVGRGLSIDIGERFSAEKVPLYQRTDLVLPSREQQGGLKRLHAISRQFILTLESTPYIMNADPLSLATEAWRICEMCKVNAITSPLELTVSAHPADSLARRFVETHITGWRSTNPMLMVYEMVNNIGDTVAMQPAISASEAAVIAAAEAKAKAEAEAEAEAAKEAEEAKTTKADGFTKDDRKVAQAFAIAANNLLAGDLDDPKGLLYLAVAEYILPQHPQLVELRTKIVDRQPVTESRATMSEFDLADMVLKRISVLSSGANLRNPGRRRQCAFYVAVARELGVEDDELKPTLLSLEMFEQPVDSAKVLLGMEAVKAPPAAPSDEIVELERQVRGNDPDEVDRLLARAEELARAVDMDARLSAIINRLEQYRNFWNEQIPCPDCEGKGRTESACATCGGNAKLPCKRCHWTGKIVSHEQCPACNGTGKRLRFMTCKDCNGTGIVEIGTDCPDCGGTGNLTCPDCKGAGKTATLCTSCAGIGSRLRRELHRTPAPTPAEASIPAVEAPAED
jgi:hypothetical protein